MRILWLKTELLHPVDKGGKIRTYQMLRAMAREHHVTYLTLDDGSAAPDAIALAGEYCAEVVTVPFHPPARGSAGFYGALAANIFSSLPYALARYRSAAFRGRLLELLRQGSHDVVVCDFLVPTVNVPDSLPCATVLFQHNVEAEIWRRHTEVASNPLKRAYFRRQWRRMEAYERAACRRFDVVVAVSEPDATHFRDVYRVADPVAVPTGVDTDYFRPEGFGPREGKHLVFTGSMDWMPNEDGIRFFAEEVMPRLRELVPGVKLSVVGRAPTAALEALAARHHDIQLTGRVPDVRPWLARAAASVVPLRVGGGTRLKIYEAMAMECPVVSTTIGAEGLPLRDGEHLLIADDAEALAAACAQALTDGENIGAMARRAARYVREQFGWSAAARAFASGCQDAIDRHRQLVS